nr:hypothetical protein [Candidatus Sigynarchaeum springense]
MNSFRLVRVGKIEDATSLVLYIPASKASTARSQGSFPSQGEKSREQIKIKCSNDNKKICEPFLQELLANDNIMTRKSFQTTLTGDCNQVVVDPAEGGDILVLREEIGVRMAILFALIANEMDSEHVERMAREVRFLQREETYYWYAKIFQDRIRRAGIKALKILLLNQISGI